MHGRVYFFETEQRRFSVRMVSDMHGYSARLMEVLSEEEVVPATMNLPPQLEISPASFYRDRRHYRAELVRLVNAELREERVTRGAADSTGPIQDAFIRANMTGWPEGFPDAVADDLEDWISVLPQGTQT